MTHPLVKDCGGSVTIMAGATLMLLTVIVALTVDVGSVVMTRRHLQAATDLAALAAVRASGREEEVAKASLADNKVSDATLAVTVGSYALDSQVAAAARFGASSSDAVDAVRVSTSIDAPLYMLKWFSDTGTVPVSAEATAVHGREGAINAGTGLASLDNGVVNALLSGLLGGTISLSAMSYDGLMSTQINLLSFLDAMALNLDLEVGSYAELLDAEVRFGDLLDAAVEVTTDEDALTALIDLRAQADIGKTLRLGDLVDLGLWAGAEVNAGQRTTGEAAKVALFDLVTLAAQVCNGGHFLEIPLGVDLPGIASISLSLSLIESRQARIGVGPEGTWIHTAQTRLQFNTRLLPMKIGSIDASVVNLPIYLEVANGDAYISDIGCSTEPRDDGTLTVMARSGIASAYIGEVTEGAMTNDDTAVTVKDATIINVLGLLKVSGKASANLGSGSYAPLTFAAADLALGPQTRRVSSGIDIAELLSSVVSDLSLQVTLSLGWLDLFRLGISTCGITHTVEPVLETAVSTVQPTIDTVLQALGIQLGYMDVTATGMRCGAVALVQ